MATFPYLPLMAIMASVVSSIVVQMSVFAYAGFMVEYLEVVDDKDESGYYAGALSAAFMIGRVCSSHVWGVIADRYGRRFVLVFGTMSTMVFSLVFGCSTTFTMAFISRCLLGLLTGVIVVSRTLVSEVCTTKEHETIGMGVMTTSWTVGTVLGPGIGGLLAEPAKNYPHSFSDNGIFARYPYLLPNVVGSGLALLALPLVILCIKDPPSAASGDSKKKPEAWYSSWSCFGKNGRDDGDDGGNSGGDYDHHVEADHALATKMESTVAVKACDYPSAPSWMQAEMMSPATGRNETDKDAEILGHRANDDKPKSLLVQGNTRVLIFVNGMFALVYSGFDELFPLWALSSAAKGGLDWSSPQIGKVFVSSGVFVLAFELIAVPYLTPRLGVNTSQRVSSLFEVPLYLVFPLVSGVSGDDLMGFILSAILLFTCYVCSNTFLLASSLTINNAAGSSRRAELNGLSLTIESVARAISPMACSVLFAFSINGDHAYPFDYHLVFYLLASIRLAAACTGWNRITDNGNME